MEPGRHRVVAKYPSSSCRRNTHKKTLCVKLHAAQSTPSSAAFAATLTFHRRRFVRVPHLANIGTTSLLTGSRASHQYAGHSQSCHSAAIFKLSSTYHPRHLTLSSTPCNHGNATTTVIIVHHSSSFVPATPTVGRAHHHRYSIAVIAIENPRHQRVRHAM